MPLRTLTQFAADERLPIGRVRALVNDQKLAHVLIGKRAHIPDGAWERYIADNMVEPCRVETPVPASASSNGVAPSTSHGLTAAAAGSARRVQAIADKLKSRSPSSSASASGTTAL